MTRRYAAETSVPVEKSRVEIERTLAKHGCDGFAYYTNREVAQIGFHMNDRMIRFELRLPSRADFSVSDRGRKRTAESAEKAWEQACRSAWRALSLVIKAKLEAVSAGITSFEVEFLPHMVVPGTKQVFHEIALPKLAEAYDSGRLPPLLGSGE